MLATEAKGGGESAISEVVTSRLQVKSQSDQIRHTEKKTEVE